MFLSNLSLKRPVLAIVFLLALGAVGLSSFFTLNINDWPDISFPYVTVTIVQPGASAEQMETDVALKLEEAIGQVSGVKHIYGNISEGVVTVWAEFTLETNPQVAAQDVRDQLGRIRGELPRNIEEPVIARFDPSSQPIITMAITGDKSIREMSITVDDLIRKRLETIPGVGAVNILGEETREIQICLDKNQLNAYGLSPSEVIASLQAENMEVPAGSLENLDSEITLRTAGKVKQVEEFYHLPVARRGDVQLYVKDIAVVKDGIKDKDNVVRYQERPAIGIEIVRQSGSNTVEVADQVKSALSSISGELPPGMKLEIVRDNSLSIRNSVNDVLRTLIEGSILAVLTVFLFLRNTRSTIISGLAIPTSIIVTFSAMKVMGFSLNNMSLIALSLSVGLLIDDAIVVVENIIRHLNQGKSSLQAARDATSEIGLAVMATTFTVVAVFIPVGMMTGEVGQFFKQFGITVAFSVLVSLLVSFTLTPVLAARFLVPEGEIRQGPVGRFLNWFNRGFEEFAFIYLRVLNLALAHRVKTLTLAMALFFASLAIIPFMGSSFVPTGDLGEVVIVGELDSGLTLSSAESAAERLEKAVASYPEVEKIYSSISADEVSVYVKTVDKSKRKQSIWELMADFRKTLEKVPGVRTSMLYNNGIVEEKQWVYRLQGDNLEQMQEYSEQAQRILENIPGAVDITSSSKPGEPEIKLNIKQKEAADLGVSTAQIAGTLHTLFTGTVVGTFDEGDESFDVRVRMPAEQRDGYSGLNNILLTSSNAAQKGYPARIALSQVVEPVFSSSPGVIRRFDRSREIILSGNLDGITLGELNDKFLKETARINMPAGYRFYASGDSERMADTFSSMGMALFMGILFIFLILAAQFESYLDPFAIMLSLPMAIIGAIIGLVVTGKDLNLVSMIGIILLMGLVTKNAILLIDFTRRARAEGLERDDALRQAASVRLRPIMMTSMAMICGMVPLALALGAGAEQRAPMADAAIGGLITSTMLTLVVVPVIYSLLDDLRSRIKAGKSKKGRFNAPEI